MIKAFLIGAIGLFVVITLFSLLIPSRVRVSRAVLINSTTANAVYQQTALLDNWKKWHPIFTMDSAKLIKQEPTSGGKDSSYIILQHGKEVKVQLITADSNSVKFLLQAAGENDIENDIVLKTLASQNAVQVEWRAVTKLHWYPWEKFYGIFIDKLTGAGYEAALNGLKEYIEKPTVPQGGI
jgi:hypothetical protein